MAIVLVAFVVFGQVVLPSAAEQRAYLTADPINPDRLGLATLDGRYMVAPLDGCDWAQPGLDVVLEGADDGQTERVIAPVDVDGGDCHIHVYQRMDTTPCLQGADGVCDGALDQPEVVVN